MVDPKDLEGITLQEESCTYCPHPIPPHETGLYSTADGASCSDCYFKDFGEEIEKHPIYNPEKSIDKNKTRNK